MKKVLLVTASLIALGAAAPAVAADLAARPYTKAPPMVAAVYDWSGFYIGANGGWGSSRNCWDFLPGVGGSVNDGCHDASGGTVGGQLGYRWQAGTWVFGLEAQGNWADFKGSNVALAAPAFRNESRVDAFGLFTGQIGYAANNVLFYVKGGAAVTSNEYRTFFAGTNVLAGVTGDDTRAAALQYDEPCAHIRFPVQVVRRPAKYRDDDVAAFDKIPSRADVAIDQANTIEKSLGA